MIAPCINVSVQKLESIRLACKYMQNFTLPVPTHLSSCSLQILSKHELNLTLQADHGRC